MVAHDLVIAAGFLPHLRGDHSIKVNWLYSCPNSAADENEAYETYGSHSPVKPTQSVVSAYIHNKLKYSYNLFYLQLRFYKYCETYHDYAGGMGFQ